mgnify:CR=1 FL=1
MLAARPVKKTGYIVITSDKGLVGGYNSKILKAMMDLIQEYHAEDDNYAIIAIGGIGADFFKARGMNVVFELRGLEDQHHLNKSAISFQNLLKCIKRIV